MKNKKLTYALGVLVTVVWGLILYRVFAAVGGGDEVVPVAKVAVKEAYNDYNIPKDTTHLLLNYRDPFGLVKQPDTVEHSKMHKSAAGFRPVPATDWSFIQYSGYIRNPASKKLVALITINGKSEMMSEGETSEKVKLLKNMRDSVKVSFNGKAKFITMHPGNL